MLVSITDFNSVLISIYTGLMICLVMLVDPKAYSLERKYGGSKDLFVNICSRMIFFFLNRMNSSEALLKRLLQRSHTTII